MKKEEERICGIQTTYIFSGQSTNIYIWDRRAWTDQRNGVGGALQLNQEGILRWWKRNLMRFFSGIKADLVSLEECCYQMRDKGFGGKVCLGRQIIRPINRCYGISNN